MAVPLDNFCHFIEHEIFNSTISCGHTGCKMWSIHVGLPQFTIFPVFKEHEMRRVGIVLMQIILDAPGFSPRDRNQLFQFSLHESNVCAPCMDPGDDFDGLLIRKVYPIVPPKVKYSLTELEESLRPINIALRDWGNEKVLTRQQKWCAKDSTSCDTAPFRRTGARAVLNIL